MCVELSGTSVPHYNWVDITETFTEAAEGEMNHPLYIQTGLD